MLDIKLIRDNPDLVKEKLSLRGEKPSIADNILELDKKRRECILETETLKGLRNTVSADIAKMKKSGENATAKIADMKKVSDDIKEFDGKLDEIEKQIDVILRNIPNLPDDNVPVGQTAEENVQIKVWGEKPAGDFKYLDHIELGKKLEIIDFEVGIKISGSGFPFYRGKGAILERA